MGSKDVLDDDDGGEDGSWDGEELEGDDDVF